MKVKGKNLMLFYRYKGMYRAYACARECTVEARLDVQEVLPYAVDDWRWRQYLPAHISWTMRADGLLTFQEDDQGLPDPLDLMEIGTDELMAHVDLVEDHPGERPEGGFVPSGLRPRWGQVIVTSLSETGRHDDYATWSMELQGTGPLFHAPIIGGVMGLRMEIDPGETAEMGFGSRMTVTCRVMRAWLDVTAEVTRWEVTRKTANAEDDAAWLLKGKVKNFAGTLEISYDEEENDLGETGGGDPTVFTFRAYIDGDRAEGTLSV